MSEFDYKISNIQKFTLSAFNYLRLKDFDNSLQYSRKCSEAICRAIILKHFGDILGKEIIEGKKDTNGTLKSQIPGTTEYEVPLLHKLIKLIKNLPRISPETITRLNDIKIGGNPASHDPLSIEKEVTEEIATFCIGSLKRTIEWFFLNYLNLNIPNQILDAFNYIIDENLIIDNDDENWNKLLIECDFFKDYQNYILISPPSYNELSQSQLSFLTKIQWSTIFDFNPFSKINGLFNSFIGNTKNQEIKPLTIEQKESIEITSTSKFIINWVFSNGLESLPHIISKDKRDWKVNLKYGQFIKKIIDEIFKRKVQKYTIVCLWDEIPYLREILERISEITAPSNIKYIIVYSNEEKLPSLREEFDWIKPILIYSSYSNIIRGIQTSLFTKNSISTSIKQFPARGNNESDVYIDITNKYIGFLEADFELLYLGIEQDLLVNIEDKPFYKGNIIRWDELSKELDIRRDKANSLNDKVISLLSGTKGAFVIELSHKPGSGGTTLGRRIAFEFHKNYPTALITKFHRDKTNEYIFEIAELTQKPILLVIEAHDISKNDLNIIVRKINSDKKHVVILYIKRVFNNVSTENSKQVFLSDNLLTSSERDRFVGKFEQITPHQNLKKIQNFNLIVPSGCEVVDFSLTAFEDEYSINSLQSYIKSYIDKLPANQLQFIGFCSLIYYYTQKSLPSNLFIKLFPDMNLEEELSLRPIEEHFIRKLLVQEYNSNLEYEDSWRPRYNRFAKEIIKLVLSPIGDWKDYLSKWVIDLIDILKTDIYYLTDDIKDIYKSLILNRDHEDVLGVDEEYQYLPIKKFSQLIEHISNNDEKLSVLRKLVEAYPDEAHYHGHLGRFLFENAKAPVDFEKAESEIFKAIELGDSDYNLWHLKGMCSRRRIEFLIRSFEQSEYESDEVIEYEEIIKDLTEIAIEDFTRSREINPANLHSHTAQIQLLLIVVQFGQKISNTPVESFLINSTNYWYEDLLNKVFELIDEAKYLIELSTDIEYLKERSKTKNMISSSEGKLFSLMGNFSQAVDRFLQLANSAERQMRPYFRKMYVYSILNSKVSNNFKKLDLAWIKLSDYEFENILTSLENNIREQPENTHNIRLWLRALRNFSKPTTIDDVLSVIKTWYDNTLNNKIAHTEATYYRYILHACKAMSSGRTFSIIDVDETKRLIIECKELAQNDRYSFEWFSNGKGIKTIVNHSLLGSMNNDFGFFEDLSKLQLMEGTITNIYNRQQGKIKLECGLDAFFVPIKGGFDKGDETKKVSFYLSFRYSGLHAWEVKEIGNISKTYTTIQNTDIEGFDEIENIPEEINEVIPNLPQSKKEEIFKNTPELGGPIIIGKIDLTQFEKYKKKR